MGDYIKRDDALDICQREYEERLKMADYCGDTVAWNIGGGIKMLPAADVAEVKKLRGHWETGVAGDTRFAKCGQCGKTFAQWYQHYPYCPWCGTPMTDEAAQMVMKRLEKMHEKT